jgi:hypothetical protein
LHDREQVLFRSAAEVDVEATVVDGGLRFEVTCAGRCGLWVPLGQGREGDRRREQDRLLLNGVPITAESDDDEWAHLTLPYAGRWTIEGARHD